MLFAPWFPGAFSLLALRSGWFEANLRSRSSVQPNKPPMKFAVSMLAGLLALLPVPGHGGITLVARETFEGVRTLDAASPGNLGEFHEGAWQCRAVGPRMESTPGWGWSGDSQGALVRTFWDLREAPYSTARDAGMIGAWVRFEDLAEAGYLSSGLVANPAMVLELRSGGDNAPFQMLGVTREKQWASRDGSLWSAAADPVQTNVWYWVQIAWERAGARLAAVAAIQPLGGTLQTLGETEIILSGYEMTTAHVLNAPATTSPGQVYRWRGRLGGATLARIDALGDAAPLPDLLPPVAQRHTWYIDPVSGDDNHDGLTPATAWRSVGKFNQESAHAGIFAPADGGYEAGDIVIIDTSQVPLDLGTQALSVRTRGLTLRPAAGQAKIRLRAHRDLITGATVWTRPNPAAQPKVWVTTDGNATDLQDVVVWENDRWLHHVRSATMGAPSPEALAELNGTPGSFHSDGTYLYLHPFGGTNPNTDGKSYTRSRFRNDGGSAVMLLAPDLAVHGIDVRKTALARASDGDSYTAYGIQGDVGFGGETLLQNCYVDYVGKHGIGFTDSNSGRHVLVLDCQVEQGSPYFNQTPFVDYNGLETATGNRTTYRRCINRKVAGLVGSTEGWSRQLVTYYLHNNGTGTQFDEVRFEQCEFGGRVTTGGGIDALILEECLLAGGDVSATSVEVNRCRLTELPVGNHRPDGTLIARNNLHVFSEGVFNASFNARVEGTVIFEGNTFDLRPYLQSDNPGFCLFQRIGALDFTFRNNVFIAPKNREFGVIEKLEDTDPVHFSKNVYETSAAATLLHGFKEGGMVRTVSLPQWQAMGHDIGSLATDALVDAWLLPLAGSPLINAGHDLVPPVDFSGRFFSSRRTIGAQEPGLSYQGWREEEFPPAAWGNNLVSGPTADPDGDGRANLLEFLLGSNPRASTSYGAFVLQPAPGLPGETLLVGSIPNHAVGATLRAEFSVDLESWVAVPLSEAAFLPPEGNVQNRRGFLSPVPATGDRFFWRWVARPDPRSL